MTEPTIDEMLEWLGRFDYTAGHYPKAIRAILEQHRHYSEANTDLVIIRAFVERVEKRLPDYDTGRGAEAMLKAYRQAVYAELTEMESNVNSVG
jgi:hypothetical protein